MSQDSQIALQGVGTSNKWMFLLCFVNSARAAANKRERGREGGRGERRRRMRRRRKEEEKKDKECGMRR